MNRQPRRRTRGNGAARSVNRAITSRLRELDLSGEKGWKLSKKGGLTDPPVYNNWTTYTRRVRIVVTTAGTSFAFNGTAAAIYSAAGVNSTVFPQFTITSISVYGPTVGGVSLNPSIIMYNALLVNDREFSDFGVPNARRPVVHVTISERDQGWLAASTVGNLFYTSGLAAGTGLPVESELIIDVVAKFRGTATALRLTPSVEPEPWDTGLSESYTQDDDGSE